MTEDIRYRGYTIREAGDAIGFGGKIGWRYIVKKHNAILTEQTSMEAAKQAVDPSGILNPGVLIDPGPS